MRKIDKISVWNTKKFGISWSFQILSYNIEIYVELQYISEYVTRKT